MVISSFIVPSAVAVGLLCVSCAVSAQVASGGSPPQATNKELIDNDKVRVYETTFAPGAEASNMPRPYRIVRALTDGTLLRSFADGRTETIVWKAGDVKELGPDSQYKSKSVGASEFRWYVVVPKVK